MSYIAPGSYITQLFQASGVSTSGFILPTVIGKGLPNKRIWGEAIVRGQVTEQYINQSTKTLSLTHTSDMRTQTSRLYRNGNDLGNTSFIYNDDKTVTVKSAYFVAGATYSFKYISKDVFEDILQETPDNILYVAGTADGSRRYREETDYIFNDPNTITWDTLESAEFRTLSEVPTDYDLVSVLGVTKKIKISVDGKTPLEISFTSDSTTLPSEVVTQINNALAADPNHGVHYNSVASIKTVLGHDYLALTSYASGESASIRFYMPSSGNATETLFGIILTDSNPIYSVLGKGVIPAFGDVYYVSYETVRDSDEYNKLRLFYDYNSALLALGPQRADNDLLIAIELAFLNGATLVGAIQVGGTYSIADWQNAIDVVKTSKIITDVALINTDVDVMDYLVRTIEEEAGLTHGHWMGGFFGVANGTDMGDVDTPNSTIYIANNTLQVGAQSQGRGRFILAGIPGTVVLTRDIVDTDTRTTITLDLDTTFLAAAIMGLGASFSPISDTYLRKQVVGFNSSSISDNELQAGYLASNGVFPILNKGGRAICFDPVTTDVGGEIVFSETNVRVQKDYLAYRLRTRLDQYIVGAMPDDMDEFIYEIKHNIGLEIKDAINNRIIGQYLDDAGKTRDLDFATDLAVFRSQTNATEYHFTYAFNARYCAKRIFGTYIVDKKLM